MLNLHALLPHSRANGPGVRLVIWFQGCNLACPGCFNPETHEVSPRIVLPVAEVVGQIKDNISVIEGITISGGEPFQQPVGLLNLLNGLAPSLGLSILLFSGYTLEKINAMPLGPQILTKVNVLIAGRYDQTQQLGKGLRGSANQVIHLLTDRYYLEDIEATPPAEVIIDAQGNISLSGISPAGKLDS